MSEVGTSSDRATNNQQPDPNKPNAKITKPTGSLPGLEHDLVNQTEQADKDTTSYLNSVAKLTSDFHSTMETLRNEAPKPPEEKPFEAPEQVNPISAFGSTAGLFAGVLSLFARAPMTTSLNALAGGMKAIQEGNATAYQRSFDEWKSNTDYAFKVYDAQHQAYTQLIDLASKDYEAAVNGIKTMATLTNDKAAQTALAMKGIEGVEELAIERERLRNETESNYFKVGIPAEIFNKSVSEFKIKNGRDPNAQELSNLYQQSLSSGIGGMDSTAQLIASYQVPMPTGYALKNMGGDALIDAVRRINPSYNANKYTAINAAYKNFTSGTRSNLVTSANVAIQHLELLKQAFDNLHNGNIQAYNSIKQRWAEETGSPFPTTYDAIGDVAAGEMVKFVQGGGRTGGALTDRLQVQKTVSRELSQNQGGGVFDAYIGLMAGQLMGQKKQYEADGLDIIQPFDTFLLPDTINALENHGGVGSSQTDKGGKKDYSNLWGG